MQVSIVAVIAATAAMFAVGAFWYMVPFAKAWGRIHDFDKRSKAEQQEMQSKMGPYYGVQLVMTVLSAWMLAILISVLPNYSPYLLALIVWLGFVLPAQVSSVIFGGTAPKYIPLKTAIMAGEALLHLQAAAFIINAIQ
ncbi:MAG: DUF1761 domain-containing protein [Candidatus Saccharimonas sp.]